jgi:ribose transport system permease protein
VRIDRTKMLVYVVGIGCAGAASLLQFSYLSMGDPTTAEGYELKVIAAVVIGGASLMGGRGSIGGTVIGVLLLNVLENGLNIAGVEAFYRYIATGLILIAAVIIDQLTPERRTRGG